MEHLHRITVMAAWIGLVAWSYWGDRLGRWWWSATLLTAAATATAPGAGAAIDAAVSTPGAARTAAHAAVAAAAGLAVRAQIAAARPGSRIASRGADAFVITAPVLLMATGLAAPVAHSALFYAAVGAAGATFAVLGLAEVRELSAGRARTVAQLLLAASVATVAWALHSGFRLAVADTHLPGWLGAGSTAGVLGSGGSLVVAGGCAIAGIWIAIAHNRATRRHVAEQGSDVLALWNWLCCDTRVSDDLFGVVIETRDRMWVAQQWVSEDDVDAASQLARRLGLGGRDARAFTTAACLELGVSALDADRPRLSTGADLSRLGGGSTPEQEAAWFAAVWRARTDHHAAAAATAIAHAGRSIPAPGRATVDRP